MYIHFSQFIMQMSQIRQALRYYKWFTHIKYISVVCATDLSIYSNGYCLKLVSLLIKSIIILWYSHFPINMNKLWYICFKPNPMSINCYQGSGHLYLQFCFESLIDRCNLVRLCVFINLMWCFRLSDGICTCSGLSPFCNKVMSNSLDIIPIYFSFQSLFHLPVFRRLVLSFVTPKELSENTLVRY